MQERCKGFCLRHVVTVLCKLYKQQVRSVFVGRGEGGALTFMHLCTVFS